VGFHVVEREREFAGRGIHLRSEGYREAAGCTILGGGARERRLAAR
jgi:hypothetical protein